MTRWHIEVQVSAPWDVRCYEWIAYATGRTFPTKRAALEYWHDSAPSRNDQCRFVEVQS